MRVIMTGGGTGGHIFPAIAIADEIRRNKPDSIIRFIGAKGKMEERVVPENGYEIDLIEVVGLNRKNMLKNVAFIYKYFNSLRKCKNILSAFAPDVVIGTGGYVTGPVLSSAVKLGIPGIIQEGNSYPGKVIKYLSSKVSKVIVNFEETKNYLKRKDNVIRISYPVRSSIRQMNKIEAKKHFGLDNNNKTIFVFGGSQGAKTINEAIERIVEILRKENINLIWQTGKLNYDKINSKYGNYKNTIKILEFIKEMDIAYSASDLVICRAGVSSIMELSAMSKPAILIPYPFATDNHQERNARSLAERESAIMITERQLSDSLEAEIKSLINNEERLKMFSQNISSIYDKDAPNKIYQEVKRLIQ